MQQSTVGSAESVATESVAAEIRATFVSSPNTAAILAVYPHVQMSTAERWDVITLAFDRQGRGLSGAYRGAALTRHEVRELRSSAMGQGVDARPLPVTQIPKLLAPALLAARIAGREIPAWLLSDETPLGDLLAAFERCLDVWTCLGCAAALPGAWQSTRAGHVRQGRGGGRITRCPSCDSSLSFHEAPRDRWLGRARVMLAARLPRRGLICAARAESKGAADGPLSALRGEALLALGQATQAAALLRGAVNYAPTDIRSRALLIDAESRCGAFASLSGHLGWLEGVPATRLAAQRVRAALSAAAEPHALRPLSQAIEGLVAAA